MTSSRLPRQLQVERILHDHNPSYLDMKSRKDKQEPAIRLSKGDEKAVAEFFQEYYPTLVHFANLVINDRVTARDIVVDIILGFWNRREHLTTPQDVRAYLFISTRNACFSYLRTLRSGRRTFIETGYEGVEGINEENAELQWMEAELMREIVREVERLPERMRAVFMLHIEGRTTEQISRALQLSPNTIRVQKARAAKQLRAALLKKGLIMALLLCLLKRLIQEAINNGYTTCPTISCHDKPLLRDVPLAGRGDLFLLQKPLDSCLWQPGIHYN